MKKLILLLAVTLVVFSCSKDNVNTETETADLTQMLPTKALDQSTDGLYVGVFGNSDIQELHGKIFINVNNDGNYTAFIEMVNGNDIKFQGTNTSKSSIHFTSNRGSFDFNTNALNNERASNVIIDNEESYIVTVKAQSRLVPHVLLGTYEETGNEANFYGNWDMMGNDVFDPAMCCNNQGLGQLLVTHKNRPTPFVITSFAQDIEGNGCMPTPPTNIPHLFDTSGDGNADSVLMGAQSNAIGNASTNYHVNFWLSAGTYFSVDCFDVAPSGTWSRGGRSGSVFVVGGPAPLVGPENITYPLANLQ